MYKIGVDWPIASIYEKHQHYKEREWTAHSFLGGYAYQSVITGSFPERLKLEPCRVQDDDCSSLVRTYGTALDENGGFTLESGLFTDPYDTIKNSIDTYFGYRVDVATKKMFSNTASDGENSRDSEGSNPHLYKFISSYETVVNHKALTTATTAELIHYLTLRFDSE